MLGRGAKKITRAEVTLDDGVVVECKGTGHVRVISNSMPRSVDPDEVREGPSTWTEVHIYLRLETP